MQKSNIREIYPLTSMQQTLLLHSLQAEEDQGFLQVRCTLEGVLIEKGLKEAFYHIFQQHKTLRTSIHWEKISKPVQVVHEDFEIPWYAQDWQEHTPRQQQSMLRDFLAKDRTRKLDLTKAPVSRISLFRFNEQTYKMVWTCHHILVDGWSSFNALADVLKVYDQLQNGQPADLPDIPSYFDHLEWVRQQDATLAKQFWKEKLAGIKNPCTVLKEKYKTGKQDDYKELTLRIDEAQSKTLKTYAQQNAVSLNAVIQGCWSVILGVYLDTDDVIYGITTNGRTFTGIVHPEDAVGMFMNVLPVRARTGGS